MLFAVQRYSAQIPWVLVEPSHAGYNVRCEVCGVGGIATPEQVPPFVQAHAQHRSPQGFGLGDAIAAIAKPIARAFGQKEPCTPCEARRRALNAAVPRVPRPWPH